MTQKKKITIVAICCAIILIGSAIGIIIATWKRFDIHPNYTISYNDHTKLKQIVLPQGYDEYGSKYYTNATTQIKMSNEESYGVFSYIENDIIVPAKYSRDGITAIDITNAQEEVLENVFCGKLGSGRSLDIAYYNSEGSRLSITEYDQTEQQMYGHILEKNLTVSLKKKGVKVKSKNSFNKKKIAITDAQFKVAFRRDGIYNYELWEITDTDGKTYINLYQVNDGKRNLVQTLNNSIGTNIESTSQTADLSHLTWLNEEAQQWVNGLFEYSQVPLYFLKDGTPMLMQVSISSINSTEESVSLAISIYDIHFNLKDTSHITINNSFHTALRVGNNIFVQYSKPASEKKYDYAMIEGDTIKYFKLETLKLNLKTGSHSSIAFDYLITDYNSSFNIETVLIHAKEIKNRLLNNESLILINDKLQAKEINYEFNYLTKINNERYIASGNNGDYLIDEKYNKICYLGNADDIFTTKDAIIIQDNEKGCSYVCDMNGTIIKEYGLDEIENIYDDTYYLVNTTSEIDGNTYKEKYLERLGVRQDTPIHSQIEGTSYTFNNQPYIGYTDYLYNTSGKTCTRLITRLSAKDDGKYVYSFYNMENKYLISATFDSNDLIDSSVSDPSRLSLKALYEDENYILVRIVDRTYSQCTLLLNK